MIANGTVSHPELGSAAPEGSSFLSTLRDLPYALHAKWETRRFLPSNNLQPDMVGRIGLAGIGVVYSTYLQMRHGIETGHVAPDYVLAGNTTRLEPSPDTSGDQGGRPWLLPDTESTHKASAVPETPTPRQTTHITPNPITPTSVEPTHSETPSTSPSTKASQSGYDDYPFGNQPTDGPMINQNTELNPMDTLRNACCGSVVVIAGVLGVLFMRGRHLQQKDQQEDYGRLRLIEDPREPSS